MKKTSRATLIITILALSITSRGYAQCTPAESCGQISCLFGPTILNNTIWSTSGYVASEGILFCSSAQNDLWFPVLSDSSGKIKLTLFPSNCESANGLQMAIYESCSTFPIACHGGQQNGGSISISLTANVTPGKVYYLMVDGYVGDICDFTVQVTGILDVSNISFVTGAVFADLNFDCIVDSSDVPVPEVPIVASGLFNAVTPADSLGRFEFVYPAFSALGFNLTLDVWDNDLWELCTDTFHINPSGGPDTSHVTFLLQPQDDCTDMRVDLSLPPFFRPCQYITIPVKYANQGTITAENVVLDIAFSPLGMNITNATMPFDSLGDTLRFFLGNVPPFGVGYFKIFAQILCEGSVGGRTFCFSAHIFPDTACAPNVNWSGAHVALAAACDADTVVYFTLQNTGTGPMSSARQYTLIKNAAIVGSGMFQLDAGQDTTFVFAADGATWRMEAEQEPGHPGMSSPSVSIEGCGGLSPGFINAFPQDDADLFRDIECREVLAAYDPNIKVASPVGAGSNHIIQANIPLEYTIHFQNTGTDTAFFVRLVDILPITLDPSTFRPGASSHPCTWRLLGFDTLEVVFDPIVLPDSNKNEPASHGWFEFRIAQRPNLPTGTILRNTAAIYFDYNAPIITEPSIHTIGELTVQVDDLPANPEPGWRLFGNPLYDRCHFVTSKSEQTGPCRFELYDLQGQLLRSETFSGNQFTFHRQGQPAGVYAFRLIPARGAVFAGKLVIP